MANPLLYARAISRALAVVGDRSSLLLTYWVFLGRFRFTELVKCTGLSKSLVSNRLKRLIGQGVIERRDVGGANEFHLTEMGKDLYDVALAIIYWDKRWHFTEGCVTHHLKHAGCGKEFSPVPSCASCLQAFDARACDWHYGPGEPDSSLASDMPSRRSRIAASALNVEHPIMDRTLEILGDRWTALTIAAAFYRVRSFGGFQQALGIASNILSDRLSRLTELGIFTRNGAGRAEYRLTEEGLSLFPVIVTLMRWGDRWFCEAPALVLSHRACQNPLVSTMLCDQCGSSLGFGDFYY
ncbi:winged helix-turn-helix transcriptional regulator [Litorivivens lipolytica]|nr:helix-turn-helix domain-containing protein [Litorivivens lipolytica]